MFPSERFVVSTEFELNYQINKLYGILEDIYWELDNADGLSADQVDQTMKQALNIQALVDDKLYQLEQILDRNYEQQTEDM